MNRANYSAERQSDHGVDVIKLVDVTAATEVWIAPSLGNRAYAMNVQGSNILHMPAANVAEIRELCGIPFMGPWANRIPGGGFRANGKWFAFNDTLGVLRMHPAGVAIHGMLTASDLWRVSEVGSDEKAAWVTSRLEFWRYSGLMANWPFAHEYEMTYRLSEGMLETRIVVSNVGAEAMPIAVGFHPYFTIPGVQRSSCRATVPARTAVVVDERLCATGEMKPNALPTTVSLAEHTFDDGFTDLVGAADGRTVFGMEGGGKRIEVVFGPKYQVAIVYSPPGREFVCFEPMAAITNGINLAAEGKYHDLQWVAPGAVWQESFWVRVNGFCPKT